MTLRIQYEIDAGHQLVKMVSSGEGYGVFAQSAFVDELREGHVRAVPLNPSYQRTVCLTSHRRSAGKPEVIAVRAHMQKIVSELRVVGVYPS